MCGIAGKIDFGAPVDSDVVVRMCAAMQHRGPDSRGLRTADGVAIGAQRLAIIDLAHGDQPVVNEDGTIMAALNGEIYNFRELHDELRVRGHTFRSYVDTEVLVHLYEERGERMVEDLRGMFAFAIWDDRKRRLLCGRDRAGKKPLYWARRGRRVWFASELRALLQDPELWPEVDPRAVDAYLALQYVPHPLSIFRGVSKVPPATTMSVDSDGENSVRYWSLDYSSKSDLPVEDATAQLRERIRDATRIRLISEVPLGAFLSGGIDSSVVVASMAEAMSEPVKTFSIGFPERDFDELEHARLVAERFGTDHHEFVVQPDAMAIMPKLARHYGEPYADPSAIPSFYLAELTKSHVTVALNGDGGDESFAGYSRYRANRVLGRIGFESSLAHRIGSTAARIVGTSPYDDSTRSRTSRAIGTLGLGAVDRYIEWMSPFPPDRRARLLSPEFGESVRECDPASGIRRAWHSSSAADLLDTMLDVDVQTYLPDDLLVKMDIATMAYSVEARSPLLDNDVMEFAASLPPQQKLAGGRSKHLLKEAFRGIVPDPILDRPKQGFGVPLRHWFRNELRQLPQEMLLDPEASARGYFRTNEVERLIREHHDGHADHALRLWVLIQLEMWHREVADPARVVGVNSSVGASAPA